MRRIMMLVAVVAAMTAIGVAPALAEDPGSDDGAIVVPRTCISDYAGIYEEACFRDVVNPSDSPAIAGENSQGHGRGGVSPEYFPEGGARVLTPAEYSGPLTPGNGHLGSVTTPSGNENAHTHYNAHPYL